AKSRLAATAGAARKSPAFASFIPGPTATLAVAPQLTQPTRSLNFRVLTDSPIFASLFADCPLRVTGPNRFSALATPHTFPRPPPRAYRLPRPHSLERRRGPHQLSPAPAPHAIKRREPAPSERRLRGRGVTGSLGRRRSVDRRVRPLRRQQAEQEITARVSRP